MMMRIAFMGLTLLTSACDGQKSEVSKISQEERTELNTLREEKKVWALEKAKMQASLDWREKKKNEVISELGEVKDELKACQDKQASTSEAKPAAKDQKTSVEKLLKK